MLLRAQKATFVIIPQEGKVNPLVNANEEKREDILGKRLKLCSLSVKLKVTIYFHFNSLIWVENQVLESHGSFVVQSKGLTAMELELFIDFDQMS